MDTRNRITLRLPSETIKGWTPATIAKWPASNREERKTFTQEAMIRLAAAVNSYAPGQKITLPISSLLMVTATKLALVSERLEWLRRRLRVALPASLEDLDLISAIEESHNEARIALIQMGNDLAQMEALAGVVIGPARGDLLDLFTQATTAAAIVLEDAPITNTASLDFCLALLLIATGATPPPHNGCLGDLVERAESHGLLPQDQMLGVPDYRSMDGAKNIADNCHIFVKLPPAQQAGFMTLASVFQSENHCANVLLQVYQTAPNGVECAVEYEIRLRTMEALVSGWMSLRGFLEEAEFCQYASGISPQHDQLLEEFQKMAAELEYRALPLIHLVAGSSWIYAPDFLLSLDPLLAEVKKRLASATDLTHPVRSMVELLQRLRIIAAESVKPVNNPPA